MRRLFTPVLTLALVAILAAAPAWADTFSFTLNRDGNVKGTQLAAGKYKLEISNGEAVIYQGKELVAKAAVEVKPRTNGSTGTSVLQDANGTILEVRTKKQVVVFTR